MRDDALITMLRTVRDAIDVYLSSTGHVEAQSISSPGDVERGDIPFLSAVEVQRVVLAAAAERTGYPEDMLELDLDVEADLGIDSIKQVAIYTDVCHRFGLPADPEFKMRDHTTLRKLISYFAARVAAQDRHGVGSAL